MNKKYALVTGASSGIGKSIATEMASRKMDLLLVSLPNENLAGVGSFLQKEYSVEVHILETDLSEPDGPRKVFEWAGKNHYPVYFLVNNAGIAGTAHFEQSDDDYIDKRILVNIRALVFLTRYFLPSMLKMEEAYILNVSSLSAFYSIPFKSLYSASKAFVLNFSRALKTEFKKENISITVLCPNGVKTNEGTFARIEAHGNKGKWTAIASEDIARISVDACFQKKFLLIPGRINRILIFFSKLIPRILQQRILYNEFSKELKVS